MRFIQIALASDVENGGILYALGDDGILYERVNAFYGPGEKYQGKSITRGRATTAPFWREVDLPFEEPALEEKKLALLEFEKEEG